MGVITAAFYMYANSKVQSYYVVFCASILLFQSIYSAFTLLIISVKSANKAGDAKNLSTFTYIPAVIWALLFFSFALFVAYRVLFLLPCSQFILT
jgi:hypothetical protein